MRLMIGRARSAITRSVLRAPVATSAAQVEARLGEGFGARTECLLARGKWPHEIGAEWAERIGVFCPEGDRLRLVLDCWMTRAAMEELGTRVPEAMSGGWDVMLAGGWRYAWGGKPFRVWSRREIVARVDGPRRLALGGGAGGPPREVAELRAEISRDWLTRELVAVWSDGATTSLAQRREWATLWDPTYDGLDLLADADWLAVLASELAEALGVSLHTNDPVLRMAPRGPA